MAEEASAGGAFTVAEAVSSLVAATVVVTEDELVAADSTRTRSPLTHISGRAIPLAALLWHGKVPSSQGLRLPTQGPQRPYLTPWP